MALCRLFLDSPLKEGQDAALSSNQRHYVNHVMRCAADAALVVFNGQGGEFSATLQANGASCRINTFAPIEREMGCAVHIIQAVCRGERMEWMLQKATELGAASFTIIRSSRSMVKLAAARRERRLQRWQQIIIEASEQSGRTRVPTVVWCDDITTLPIQSDLRFLLHPKHAQPWLQLRARIANSNAITLAIGPEGGFDANDLTMFNHLEFHPLQFGERILRTETAAPALLAAIQAVTELAQT